MAHPLGYGHDVSPVYTQMPGAKKLPQAMRSQIHPQSLDGRIEIPLPEVTVTHSSSMLALEYEPLAFVYGYFE